MRFRHGAFALGFVACGGLVDVDVDAGAPVTLDASVDVAIDAPHDAATDTAKESAVCDHDCLGGDCLGGVCQPVTLASGEDHPYALTIDDDNVYWTDTAQIRKVAKTGGTPVTLATGQGALSIAVDANNVYWAHDLLGTIEACAKSGCNNTPTKLATNQGTVVGIATDGASVYWAQYSQGGEVRKCAVGGCNETPTTLVGASNGYAIATDGTDVFFTNPGAMKCSVNGCTTATTLGSTALGAIVVDSTNAYWFGSFEILECNKNGCGSPKVLATGYALSIAVDSTDVYWTNGVGQGSTTGTISRCAINGCATPTVVTTGHTNLTGVAVDASYVYFADFADGVIQRIAK